MKTTLSHSDGREFEIRVSEITAHDPSLIDTVLEIDLMTFSEPTWSRYTAGLMLRHGRNFLLFADDVPIGTCQCMRSWQSPWEVVLFSMAIRPGWRGQGLGTFFLESTVDALKRSGTRSVVLEVDPSSTAAIRLYEQKFGFKIIAECQNEYGIGHDRVHMQLMLQANPIAEVSEFPSSGLQEEVKSLSSRPIAKNSLESPPDSPLLEASPADRTSDTGVSNA